MTVRLRLVVLFVLASFNLFSQTDSTARDKSAPVVFNSDTLFYIKTNLGPFSPGERAEAITRRLEELSEHNSEVTDSIRLHEDDHGSFHLIVNKTMVMTITRKDASLENRETYLVSEDYAEIVKTSLKNQIKDNNFLEILKEIALTIVLIALLYLVFRVINRIAEKVYTKIESLRGTKLTGWKIKDVEILNQEREVQILILATKVVRIAVLLLIISLALPALFNIFPWTKGIADTIFDFILTPLQSIFFGFVGFIPNLFFIMVIIMVTKYLIKGIHFLANEVEKGTIEFNGFHKEWAGPTYNIIRIIVYAFAVVVIFPYLPGSQSGAFKGVSIFLGVLFSLGSSSAISNLVAGLVITYMVPFKIGDRIKIGENIGDVIDRTMLVTRLRTIKNEEITIPNALVLSGHVFNYSSSQKQLILYTSVTIGYDVPWAKVHELLIQAGLDTNRILKDPIPFILQKALGSYAVDYELNCYTDKPNEFEFTYSELHQSIQDKFNEAGVEILTPIYSAIRDGNHSTVASDKLPTDYKQPAFSINLLDKLTGK